jgi:hypothetical protein
MGGAFVEHRSVKVSDALRQGDVLEAVDPETPIWQRYLMVITADCDFAFDKHFGRVTCVPLLRADDYLLQFQIPKLRERLTRKPLSELLALIEAATSRRLTEYRLRQWIAEESAEEIADALGLTDGDREHAVLRLAMIQHADAEVPSLVGAIEQLTQAQIMISPTMKIENARGRVQQPLQQAYTHPPGDALFLSAIGESYADGYFAYLRHIEQVPEGAIALGPTRTTVSHRRISRLQDRYTHALVQRFALVFMSIGLPTEYEEMRDIHAELIGVVT